MVIPFEETSVGGRCRNDIDGRDIPCDGAFAVPIGRVEKQRAVRGERCRKIAFKRSEHQPAGLFDFRGVGFERAENLASPFGIAREVARLHQEKVFAAVVFGLDEQFVRPGRQAETERFRKAVVLLAELHGEGVRQGAFVDHRVVDRDPYGARASQFENLFGVAFALERRQGVGHARTVHAAAEIDAAEVGIGVLEFVFQFEPGVVDHLVGDAAGQSERFGSPDQGGGQQKEKQQTFHDIRN